MECKDKKIADISARRRLKKFRRYYLKILGIIFKFVAHIIYVIDIFLFNLI